MQTGDKGCRHGEIIGREDKFVGPAGISLHVAAHAHSAGDAAQSGCADSANLFSVILGKVDHVDKILVNGHFL